MEKKPSGPSWFYGNSSSKSLGFFAKEEVGFQFNEDIDMMLSSFRCESRTKTQDVVFLCAVFTQKI